MWVDVSPCFQLGPCSHHLALSPTQDCTLYLLGSLTALRLHKIRNCRIYTGPVRGSCFLEDCRDTEIHVASYQIRVHQTFDTCLCMRVKSRPIIEHCERVAVVSRGDWADS